MKNTNLECINSACIEKSLGLTGKVIDNICSGDQFFIPYGALDYVIVALVLIALIVVVGFTYVFFKELKIYLKNN